MSTKSSHTRRRFQRRLRSNLKTALTPEGHRARIVDAGAELFSGEVADRRFAVRARRAAAGHRGPGADVDLGRLRLGGGRLAADAAGPGYGLRAVRPRQPGTGRRCAARADRARKPLGGGIAGNAEFCALDGGKPVTSARASTLRRDEASLDHVPKGAAVVDLRDEQAHADWAWPESIQLDFERACRFAGALPKDRDSCWCASSA